MHPIVSWAPISYASSVVFDTTILLLTLIRLPRNLMAKSYIGRQIFRDTLMYFTITTVTNIVVLSIQSLGESHSMIKPTAVPFSTVMTVTMGSRVYLNLKLLEKRRREEGDSRSIPLSVSQGTGGGHGVMTTEFRTTTEGTQMDTDTLMSTASMPNYNYGYSKQVGRALEKIDSRTGSEDAA